MNHQVIHKHDGGHFLKSFEVRNCGGRFFVYRSTGDYTCDAPTKKEIFEKLAKHLYCAGLIDNEQDYIESIGVDAPYAEESQKNKLSKLSNRSQLWLDKINKTLLKLDVQKILKGESVEIGYRSTCGSGARDSTHVDFELFLKLLKALKSQGFIVSESPVKHENRYAGNNGGFWNSSIYKIEST